MSVTQAQETQVKFRNKLRQPLMLNCRGMDTIQLGPRATSEAMSEAVLQKSVELRNAIRLGYVEIVRVPPKKADKPTKRSSGPKRAASKRANRSKSATK